MFEWVKKNALIAGLILAGMSLILTLTYRQYIYENNIFDFYIADTLGSLFCIPAASLFFYGVSPKKSKFIDIVKYATLGFFIYEFLSIQPFHGVFDIADLIAMSLSSIFTIYFYLFLKKKGNK